jgi:fatty acid desaturase
VRQSSDSRPTKGPTSRPTAAQTPEPQPLPWRATRVALWGVALWAVALLVTLAVPALHTGDRSWWPWTCVAGIVLGFLGYGYVRRGRGNASDAN